jgi:hypothetical protein
MGWSTRGHGLYRNDEVEDEWEILMPNNTMDYFEWSGFNRPLSDEHLSFLKPFSMDEHLHLFLPEMQSFIIEELV